MKYYRSEEEGYRKYPKSFLHPFEQTKIRKAIKYGIMNPKAIEIVERWEKENNCKLTYDNFEEIYTEDYMNDSLFYLTGKLVFSSEKDARYYGTKINCCGDYIVEYSGTDALYMGCEPTRDGWEKGCGRIYHISNPVEISKESM